MTLVAMFPGQSSRYPGMLDELCELHAPNLALLERASQVLGRDLKAHYRAANAGAFERNRDVQIGVFLANHLSLQMLASRGVRPDLSLGLSLGELNHLVHIEVLDFEDALRLVEARGEAYDRGPRGWMAAVQPIDPERLEAVLDEVRSIGRVEIVSFNSPRQQVIAGEVAAVRAAMQRAEELEYAQSVVIERQVPMHSSLFRGVGRELRRTLRQTPLRPPRAPHVSNVTGSLHAQPSRQELASRLEEHVCSPVRWRQSIDALRAAWPDARFLEVGPRRVLHDLLDRRWFRGARYHSDHRERRAEHLRALVAELAPRDVAATRPAGCAVA